MAWQRHECPKYHLATVVDAVDGGARRVQNIVCGHRHKHWIFSEREPGSCVCVRARVCVSVSVSVVMVVVVVIIMDGRLVVMATQR